MDILAFVVDLALLIFILVALGQLFSISGSLKRLVAMAETPPAEPSPADTSTPLAQMKEEVLKRIWTANPGDPSIVQEMRVRGFHMD
jgi:hypothetical protein